MICVIANKTVAISVKCEPARTLLSDGTTCNMQQTTVIESDRVTIFARKDPTIAEINLSGNKKIFFLPIRADKNFPNLTSLDAHDCSISSISKEPFRNSWPLKKLNLTQNYIENIPVNTFDDLAKLQVIAIGINCSSEHFVSN